MKYLLILLMPAFALASGNDSPANGKISAAADLSIIWTYSFKAETEKNYDEALRQTAAFLNGGGDRYTATLRAAWLHYLKADYLTAASNYASAARLQTSAITPLIGLLNTTIATGDQAKISQAAESIIKLEPSNYRAQMALASVSYSALDYRRANTIYRRVLLFYPEDMEAISGAAWSALNIAQKKEALDGFRKLLSVNHEYPRAQQGYEMAASLTAGMSTPAKYTASARFAH